MKEEIEDVLVPHTEIRFKQYQETPFGNSEGREKLGLDCTLADAVALMNGTYERELEHLSAEARARLLTLKAHNFGNARGVISTNLMANDWVNGWAKMRVSKSSAAGGHYDHYKTAAVAARLPADHPPDHTV